MELRKAARQKTKLKLGIAGPSGSGKTYSALLMASGMTSWSKIALIDTENGSGELYSGLGEYNVITLGPPFTPERYIEAITTCERAGMEVIIVDSVTHEWDGEGGLLDAHSKMLGNSFTNWSKITPRHNRFIQSIVQSPCHVITCVRKKQDYDMSQGADGRTRVTKVGLKEVQREGFEYELTVNFELDMNHRAIAGKDRTKLFVDTPDFIITPETGAELKKWCEEGVEPVVQKEAPSVTNSTAPTATPTERPHLQALKVELKKMGAKTVNEGLAIINQFGTQYASLDITEKEASTIMLLLLSGKPESVQPTIHEVKKEEVDSFQKFIDEPKEHSEIVIPEKSFTKKRPRIRRKITLNNK